MIQTGVCNTPQFEFQCELLSWVRVKLVDVKPLYTGVCYHLHQAHHEELMKNRGKTDLPLESVVAQW